MERSKEDIWHMVKYVLDIEDEKEIASWTKALLDLREVQKKHGFPTAALLTIDNEIFTTDSMAIYPGRVHITSNRHEKYLKQNNITPDIHVLGDVTIEKCEAPLHIHGNVFSKNLVVKGDFNPSKFVNIGQVIVNCENFSCDDITISGAITINAKSIISTEIKSNQMNITGNIEKCTFLNADNLQVQGDINSNFINQKNEDDIEGQINHHFNPAGK